MNINQILVLIVIFAFSIAHSQTIEELYEDQNYSDLIKFADKANDLTKDQLYYVGYAFFQLEDDKKAIEMYDKAISKGLDDSYIYFFKGLSLRYDKQNNKAIENFKIAINRDPKGQKNYSELANTFYHQKLYDSALVYYYKARELNYELGDPYLKIPVIYHIQENYKKALEEYKISAALIDKEDPYYVDILKSIGQIEYTVFKRYENAIKAFTEMVLLVPNNYDLYPKLIKSYYANEQYNQGDSLFQIMKTEYEKGGLPEEYQKYGSVAIDEFEWNEQTVITYRYFKDATETLDISYKIYLLNQDGESIDRTLMTEKTIQLDKNGVKHLLCEREKNGTHHTYAHGWVTDDIDFKSLKKAVILVLDKKISPSASSSYGVVPSKKKNKRKRKKKK